MNELRKRISSSLQLQFTVWVGVIILVLSLTTSLYSVITSRQAAINTANQEVLYVAEAQAGNVQGQVDPAFIAAKTMADSLAVVKDPANPVPLTRDQVNAMLKKVAEENPDFLGTWTLWEPNAFDGMDAQYANTPLHDETGRFIPYWVRVGSQVEGVAIVDYETPGLNDFYSVPRETKIDTILDPYFYEIDGADVLLTSLVAPIVVNDTFYGVAGVDLKIDFVQNIVDDINLYNGKATAVLFTEDGELIAVGQQPDLALQPATTLYDDFDQLQSRIARGESFSSVSSDGKYLRVFYPVVAGKSDNHWTFSLIVPFSEITAEATSASLQEGLLSIVIIALALYALWYLTGQFIRPIRDLTTVANEITQGNLETAANIRSENETGILANAFNTMTSQLRTTLATLEDRVAARTRNIEVAAEVGRSVSQVRNLDVMLKDACELILKEFNLYYVQVYLANPNGSTLKLEAGTGTVGAQLLEKGHSLALNANSINGRAATEKRSVVISDTSKSATFRQNPLLPETRGEMAVPLIVNNKVVGVLDMQSSEAGVLTEDVLSAFEALAGQLAVAIQNANLLAEVEQARVEVEKQAASLVRTNWHNYLDALHKPESTGYVFDGTELKPLAAGEENQMSSSEEAIAAPIEVLGEQLGSLVIEMNKDGQTSSNIELVNVVARQVAQQIESLRLLDNAERYRRESEEAATRATLEGWKKYIESRPENILGYVYDTREVKVLDRLPDHNSVTLPIRVGDGTVGKIAVQDLEVHDDQTLDMAKAVVERLAAHIENLRLLEETKQSQIELDKRAAELQSVAEIATQSSQATEIDEMLQMVADLTKSNYDLYHAHIYLLDDAKTTLTLAAGAGEIGRQMVGEKLTINIDHPHSLVARAARSGQGAISNDVTKEPDFLPHPLLPKTKAEMAIPIKLGERVLGVLDVQGDRINRFTEEDIAIKTTLAQQVGASLDNMRQYQISQKIARELGVVANVSTATATITDAAHLLTEVVDQTKAAFDLYHVHIYLMNTAEDTLELAAGAGEVGRKMVAEGRQIPVTSEKSLVARAARTRTGSVVNDVRSDPDFLPNPLLPDTRAELAVPMIVGERVIGVLDVQSEQLNRFTEIDVNIKTTLAAQIAVALQNARTFTQAQNQAKREAMLNTINQKIQSATSVEAVLQIAARELGRALSAPLTVAQLGVKNGGHDNNGHGNGNGS